MRAQLITLSLAPDAAAAARASIASLEHVLERALDVSEVALELAVIDADAGLLATVGAGENGLTLECGDGFRRIAAAAAALNVDGDVSIVESHGWPILSVVGGSSTVAGRGGAASLTPEGRTA